MILHPAREWVAPTTEKTAPASPADVFFAGQPRATMKYEMADVHATLTLRPVPTVFLTTPLMGGIHSYLASQVIDCAALGSRFGIASPWDDGTPVFIDAAEVSQFALWIRSQIQPKDGKFMTTWIPSDPRDPF